MIGKLTEIEERAAREFTRELRAFSGDNIKQVLLFGSKARGDFHKESDIDIFVLVGKSDSAIRKKIASLTTKTLLQFEILLSPKIVEESHFVYLKQLETAFAKNIEKDGIKI